MIFNFLVVARRLEIYRKDVTLMITCAITTAKN